MQDNYTHICIVLDASGSMSDVESDTRGSFNNFIKSQKDVPGKATLDVYQFDDESTKIVDFVDLSNFNNNVMEKYHCGGCTALNDAVCQAIDDTGKKLAAMDEKDRPAKVSFVILTDGYENASRKFSSKDVKERIKHQTEVYKWDFVYLAANQDAFATGDAMGFQANRCLSIATDSARDMERNARIMCSYAKARRSLRDDVMMCCSMEKFAEDVDREGDSFDFDAKDDSSTTVSVSSKKKGGLKKLVDSLKPSKSKKK